MSARSCCLDACWTAACRIKSGISALICKILGLLPLRRSHKQPQNLAAAALASSASPDAASANRQAQAGGLLPDCCCSASPFGNRPYVGSMPSRFTRRRSFQKSGALTEHRPQLVGLVSEQRPQKGPAPCVETAIR